MRRNPAREWCRACNTQKRLYVTPATGQRKFICNVCDCYVRAQRRRARGEARGPYVPNMPYAPLTDAKRAAMVRAYTEQLFSLSHIAERIGHGSRTVRRVLVERGVPIRPRALASVLGKRVARELREEAQG